MKTVLYFLLFITALCFLPIAANAQTYYQVTDTGGTQNVGGINVTISKVNISDVLYSCGVYGPYETGLLGNSVFPKSYKYVFSGPVYAIRSHWIAVDPDDTMRIDINGATYYVTSANLSNFSTPCFSTPNTVIAYNGMVAGTFAGGGHPAIVQLDIQPGYAIDSIEFIENTYASGIDWDFFFSYTCPGLLSTGAQNDTICSGDSLHLYSSGNLLSGAATYSWSGPNGFGANLQNPSLSNASQLAAGTYYVTVSDTGSCVYTDSISIAVNPTPAINFISSNSPVCIGDSLHLSAGTTQSGAFYYWAGPNGFSDTQQNTFRSPLVLADGGYYYITDSLDGCGAIDSVMVNVNPVPATPIASSNSPVCVGDSLDFSVSNSQLGASYTWSGPGSYNSTLQNPVRLNAQTSYSGTYKVVVSMNGCKDSATSIAVINAPSGMPSVSISVLPNDTICAGASAVFTAIANNAGSPAYQWKENGTNVGTNSAGYSSSSIANGATVYCKIASSLSCQLADSAASNMIVMHVRPIITQTLGISQFPLNYTTGSLVTFTGLPSPNTNITYQWTKNGINIAGQTNDILSTSNLNAGDTICLIIHSSGACVLPDSLEECVELTTGIPPSPLKGESIVWPNPVTNQLFIESAAPGTTISIYNIVGQRIYSGQINQQKTLVDTKGFANGAYILELINNDGERVIRKIVKE